MPIPELTLQYDVRAKVRIGVKTDAGHPRSVDHFVSDDPEVKGEPSLLRIVLPHPDVEANFNTGLEWWVRTKEKKNQLACYTKGDGTALRLQPYLNDGNVVVGEPRGAQKRMPIECPFRECPQFQSKDCKPMGRLVFFIEGGRTDQVLQLDTKGWNTIEKLTATLTGARTRGPLTGRVFELSVAFEQHGGNRYPVLSLRGADVEATGKLGPEMIQAALAGELDARQTLAVILDDLQPGWRQDPKIVQWVKDEGVEGALRKLEGRVKAAVEG